ncbi:MAG: error-prone DNA polymerase [Myxococcales bacterium]|nr:error-prone DNA polymerase [Myxococcales bacterium]
MPLPGASLPEADHEVLEAITKLREAHAARRPGFVELVARSSFSFLSGASSPESLVEAAAKAGYDTVGLTDLHGLYGVVRAHEAAKKFGVRLVVGAELVCPVSSGGSSASRISAESSQGAVHVAVHVESHEGYESLCRILTQAHALRPRDDRKRAEVMLSSLAEHARGLFATLLDPDPHAAEVLLAAFGPRASLGVTMRLDGHDRERLALVTALERRFAMPVLATNRVLFAHKHDRPTFDVLTCIREKTTLERAGRFLLPNAEAHLKTEEAMAKLFSANPAWLARSRAVADACTFSIGTLAYHFPSDACVEARETPDDALRRLTYEGAASRYPSGVPEGVREQLEKELALIRKINVAPYFLSVRHVVDMARRRDILCQGRGSAANSAVCFCLGITAVDPARSSMLFERFLSAERAEPPDIDVDFEHERREEVIQEIYATYGRDRAAMVSEVVSYRGKSALREVGKVLGLSPEQVDRLSAVVSFWDGPNAVEPLRLAEAGFDPRDPRLRMVIDISSKIQGFPRHLSVHVGGFVLSSRDLSEVAPVEPATMEARTIVPWDKDDVDALGFFKVDVLALGMLTAIRKALELVKDDPVFAGASNAIDRLAAIPPEDPAVYDALCRADTVGVFQIESRAQMAMLPRLRPRCFYDLVVEVAIVRPGPIQGGMVHPYLRRRNGEEAVEPPHPRLASILERTLGVPLFQEQVMQIAIAGAGYTGGEADQLRRDMAAWKRHGGLTKHEARLAEGFAKNGIPEAFAKRLYEQIKGFGEYGFPESHAASFALLVYASAWLKVHHPAAFAVALLNSQPMGFYSPSSIVEDAKRHGITVLPVCVHASSWDSTLQDPRTFRIGLREVRGLPEEVGARIVEGREHVLYTSVSDLELRAGLRKDHLVALAEAGALDAITTTPEGRGSRRRAAVWSALAPKESPLFAAARTSHRAEPAPPSLDIAPLLPKLSREEQLLLDYERTGLSVADHPMKIVRSRLPSGVLSSVELARARHGSRVRSAGVVLCRQRPMTASGVVFVTLEDEHGFVNLVLFSKTYEKLRHVATTSSMLLVTGKVERQAEASEAPCVYVVVEGLERLTLRGKEVPKVSRDFR